MGKTFEQGRDEAAKICQFFAQHRDTYRGPGTKEAHVRQALIDPLFEALGWDLRNTALVAPQYREVVTEDSLDVEGQQRAPDYAFRVGTTPKFYVEAKKCGVNLAADPAPAFQLRRYGWSGKVPVSILTDFEEFAVYDCTTRPRPGDKASAARTLYLTCDQYPDRWRELWDIFSRDAVWSGAFDQYTASKRKRGTSEVDTEFLREIEGWRESLARNLALRNPALSSDDLNAAVQRTIDRVIFLRMAEDRGLEPYERLLNLSKKPDIYHHFIHSLCLEADDKYNSGIFHFTAEKETPEPPDRITPGLVLDDKVFKPILQSLYFAHGSPYHFGILPVEILGTVYERFLGKVIRLTAGHQAKVEEKPEVRKAGGVYYTPAYIVDYIVRNTVGVRIAGKSPAQLAGGKGKAPLRVLDMACGSGSFLLGAYQCLLDHCLRWYQENSPGKHPRAVHQDPRTGAWRLTIGEKKRILTTHLFGVDIDLQAVEVSKLSLLLKALEGEDNSSLSSQGMLVHERVLPNLAANIQCGNSLIGPDYFTADLLPEPGEMRRVNPFDWAAAFPQAMKDGGFDCVIGNPPYIRIQTMKEWAPLEVEIYKRLYRAAQQGNYDIYVVFIEQGLRLLNPAGRLGFICPHKFFNAKYGATVRQLIAEGQHLAHVVHFGDQQIFDGATTYTCLLFLDKAPAPECRYVEVSNAKGWRANILGNEHGSIEDSWGIEGNVSASSVLAQEWNFHVGGGNVLLDRLSAMPEKLASIANIFVGTQTSADEVFVLERVRKDGGTITGFSKALSTEVTVEAGIVVPFLRGKDIRRYVTPRGEACLISPYDIKTDTCRLLDPNELKGHYPEAWHYLEMCRAFLEKREKGRFRGAGWYGFAYPKSMHLFSKAKIIAPDFNNVASYCHDVSGHFYKTGYGIIPLDPQMNQLYLLGLLNSKLLFWYLGQVGTFLRGGYVRFWTQFLEKIPIRRVSLENKAERQSHDRMVTLVTSMLTLHQQLAAAVSEAQRTVVERQIAATDAEINRLVYGLYGLTAEEIALVEAETK